MSVSRRYAEVPVPGVHHVDFPYAYRCEQCTPEKACSLHGAEGIERDLFARHVDPSEVAAVFVEPVQGEGGYIVPPTGWMKEIWLGVIDVRTRRRLTASAIG